MATFERPSYQGFVPIDDACEVQGGDAVNALFSQSANLKYVLVKLPPTVKNTQVHLYIKAQAASISLFAGECG